MESKFEEFVKGGGHLVGTFRAGIKDFDNHVTDETFPGRLSEMFGIEIHEFSPVNEKPEVSLASLREDGESYSAVDWVDCIETKEAESLADYEKGWPADKGFAGVSRNEYGEGVAYYVGLAGEEDLYSDLISYLLENTDVESILSSPENVEVRERVDPETGAKLVFMVNHSPEQKSVSVDGNYWDLISSKTVTEDTELEGFGVMILKEK
ncbi:MAG: beta-galactosidase trimerization domain-containing protein [Candidatus Acetothermia bacterium]